MDRSRGEGKERVYIPFYLDIGSYHKNDIDYDDRDQDLDHAGYR